MQKAVGAEIEAKLVPRPGNGDPGEGPDRGFVGPDGGAGPEIVGPLQQPGRRLHGAQIVAAGQDADETPLKDAGGLRGPDPIAVALLHRGEPGVEAGRGVFEADCPDVLRQILPQGGQKLRRGQIPDRAEGGDLPQGVDPGVGAPAALDLHRLAKDPAQHSLQLALDRRLHAGQPLPSPVAAAVILE